MRLSGRDLRAGLTGEDVAELQRELAGVGYQVPDAERDQQLFGVGTARAVAAFQKSQRLLDSALVDEATAGALTRAVELADAVVPEPQPGTGEPTVVVTPALPPAAELPHAGGPPPTAAPPPDATWPPALAQPEAVQPAAAGPAAGQPVAAQPVVAQPVVVQPAAAVPPIGKPPVGQPPIGKPPVDQPPIGKPPEPPVGGPPGQPPTDQPPVGQPPASAPGNRLTGTLYLDHGLPAAGVRLVAYDIGFGGVATRLGEAATNPDGSYTLAYPVVDGHQPAIEVRAVAVDGTEVALAAPAAQPAGAAVVNLVAPAAQVAPLAPEYQRMIADVTPHLNGADLGTAQESAARADLSLLRAGTGWDARLLALAASAAALAAPTGLTPEALYGMLRAGLPADAEELSRVSPAAVTQALQAAHDGGIVALGSAEMSAATQAFTAFARTALRATVAPGTLSSHAAMLATTGLDTQAQQHFDDLYLSTGGDADQLWGAAAQAGLPVAALQLTGKLGYLTLNNAPLTAALVTGLQSPDELGAALVGKGLYREQDWQDELTTLAAAHGGAAAVVPAAYPGDTDADRLAAYSRDLARRVRLSFPTQVVRQLVATDELTLGADHAQVKEAVGTVLERAVGLGFDLGATPVSPFLRDHAEATFAGMSDDARSTATEHLRTLSRLYQISPDNTSLSALSAAGFTSAGQVTAVPYAKFVERYSDVLGGAALAGIVHRKAQQVSSVVYTFFGAAKQLDSAPPVHAMSAPPQEREQAKENLLKQYPTIESLFGSQDFCACDDCRSVLSPAAYLVDLLQFLDPDPLVWQGDLAQWSAAHGGAPYPFADPAAYTAYQTGWQAEHGGEPVPDTTGTPYQALTARRPDLAQLPLTCENTNTVLPYIDVVNEILEYHVAHGALAADAVRDTGPADSADLLAEPQYLLAQVYDATLRQARYPLSLPFDLWLATVRGFLDHFHTPLWQVLEVFRPTDELTPAAGEAYGRAAVAIERLGLTPAEYDLLTAADVDTTWAQLYGYPDEGTALAALSSARTLADRLGVSYEELVALVKTAFVNPRLATMATLRALDVEVDDVLRYKAEPGYAPFSPAEQAGFAAKLAPGGGTGWLDAAWEAGDFATLLVLADPSASCGFDTTTLRHADGSAAEPIVFVLLNYLVRLWRRLDWPLADLDRALTVFLPGTPDPRSVTAIGPAMASALLGLSHVDALREQVGGGDAVRAQLPRLWSTLTGGEYAQLFLTKGIATADPALDEPLGHYLSHLDGAGYQPYHYDPGQPDAPATGNVGVTGHLGAVRAALKLSVAEVALILADTGGTLATAPLDLPTVSVLARYALLARLLHVSVADLIAARRLSGLDPFSPPVAGPVTSTADDHAFAATLRFVEVVAELKSAGLAIGELDYLLRHEYDPVGPYRWAPNTPQGPAPAVAGSVPTANRLLSLVRELATAIRAIRAQYAVPADALAFTDEVLAAQLALALPADVVATVVGMWSGTIEYQAGQAGTVAADALDPAEYASEPAISVSYDPVRQAQQLRYRGVLVDAERTRLAGAYPSPLFTGLLDAVHTQAADFFAGNLQQHVVGADPVGFLQPADFDTLFAPVPAGLSDADRQQRDRDRRALLATAFLPFLQAQLINEAVATTLVADRGAPEGVTRALLADATLLADRAYPGRPLREAFAAADTAGVTATTGADTVTLRGYLEVPAPGAYRFFVASAHRDTAVELRFDHLADPLVRGSAPTDGAELSGFTALAPGLAYGFTLSASNTGGGAVHLLVQGEQLVKGPLEQLVTYPGDGVERLRRAYLLLAKALLLTDALAVTENELRYLLAHRTDFDGLDLGYLPLGAADDDPSHAVALFGQVLRLVAYTRLRTDTGAAPDDLLDLLGHARRRYPGSAVPATAQAEVRADVCARFAALVRRDAATVTAAADRLGFAADSTADGDDLVVTVAGFADERGLGRLWRVLTLATALGVAPEALGRWAQPAPDAALARDVRDTVQAGYEPASWRAVAQPIFNVLRQRRRDALVAHTLFTGGFTAPDQLFEYFLVDPATEPVVQTSRLRLAISAVQLFVQRCLLNLEPTVNPSAINSARWQWMKRYRVWEANRKIFLWPENWLEPEFRDDKTHLFQQLESTLLASDLAPEKAEDAFFSYLQSLEALAKLDLRAIFLEEKADPGSNTLHVLARTPVGPFKYFYRSYAHQMWTPWVPVTADIEGEHTALVVWRGRVSVFWATITEKADAGTTDTRKVQDLGDGSAANIRPWRSVQAQLNWAEYFQGEWTGRGTSGFGNPIDTSVAVTWDPRDEFVYATVEPDGSVVFRLLNDINGAFRVVSRNAGPRPEGAWWPPSPPYVTDVGEQGFYPGDTSLTVRYQQRITLDGISTGRQPYTMAPILAHTPDFELVTNAQPIHAYAPDIGELVSPFFYQDQSAAFYVEPSVTEVTIRQWNDWVVSKPPRREFDDTDFWKKIRLESQIPQTAPTGPVGPIDPESRYSIVTPQDWATDPGTALRYGDRMIGATGAVPAATLSRALGGPALKAPVGDVQLGTAGLRNAVQLDASPVGSVGRSRAATASHVGAVSRAGGVVIAANQRSQVLGDLRLSGTQLVEETP